VRLRFFPLLIASALCATGFARRDDGVTRPAGSARVVRTFDFEERRTNPTDLPRHWLRAQNDPEVPRIRPGFPLWNIGGLVYGPGAASGEGAVRLITRGGSASLLLDPGVVGVFPGADYLITAMVRTEGLDVARPRIAARLLDASGAAIDGTERTSPLIEPSPSWSSIAVELPGDDPRAAFVQIELLLLQPAEQRVADLPDELHVERQDLTGAVWFDDVRVIQLPRVEIWCPESGNAVHADGVVGFDYFVRDLTGEALDIDLVAFDDRGVVIDRATIRSEGGVESGRWEPDLPAFGWYRAVARVSSRGDTIGQAFSDAVWLPTTSTPVRTDPGGAHGVDLTLRADHARFGVAVSRLPDGAGDELAGAVRAVQAGFVSAPIWDAGTLASGIDERVDALAPAIDRLTTSTPRVELALTRVPEDLRVEAGLDPDDLFGLLTGEQGLYAAALRSVLDRFGGGVPRWRLGPAGSDRAFDRATLAADLDAISASFSRLVPTPMLALPWRVELGLRDETLGRDRTVALAGRSVDGGRQFAAAASRWAAMARRGVAAGSAAEDAEVRFEVHATRYDDRPAEGRRGAVWGFVRTLTELWSTLAPAARPGDGSGSAGGGGADRAWGLTLADAWAWTPGRGGEFVPAPELAAYRATADRLADRVFTGEPELLPGVRSMLFEGRGTAVLALWRDSDGAPVLRARLGLDEVVVYDVYGNATVVPAALDETGTVLQHTIPVGNEPRFIEGVDADLIRFLARVRLEPPLLEARAGEARHDLVMSNPWRGSIRGRYFILEPGGGLLDGEAMVRARRSWRLTPRQRSFVVPGRDELAMPVEVSFSPAEESGPRELVLDVDLSAEEDYGLVRLIRPIEVGLSEAQLDVSYRRGPGPSGPDLVVEARVTNTSGEPFTVDLFARIPGFPRDRATIAGLDPGSSATRVFPFAGAVDAMAGQRVHVAAVIEETGGRLTRSVEVAGP